jgi:circadian clock protein KaiB
MATKQKRTKRRLPAGQPVYRLRLYVAGDEPNSRKAAQTVKEVCQTYLQDSYQFEIIDVFKDYQTALKDNVLVAPTLIWLRKGTSSFLIGNFNRKKLMEFLGLSIDSGEGE